MKVSFYPLEQDNLEGALLFACRLTEKAVQLGHRIHLVVRSDSQLKQLDELLWQYRADSFVPHHCLPVEESDQSVDCRVTLGTADHVPSDRDILINLGEQVWEHHGQFGDVREIVAADDNERNLGRQRYRRYKELGYSVETKQLSTGAATNSRSTPAAGSPGRSR